MQMRFREWQIAGGENSPFAAKSSIAPFPPRVGINVTADAPHSKAKSMDRAAHSSASSAAHERRLHQHEHTQIHPVIMQKPRGIGKLAKRHAFVQPRQNFRMHGFETHRHFERRIQQIPESKRRVAYQCRMTFNDDSLKRISRGPQ